MVRDTWYAEPTTVASNGPPPLKRADFSFFLARRRRLFTLRSSLFVLHFLPCPPQAPLLSSLFTLHFLFLPCPPQAPLHFSLFTFRSSLSFSSLPRAAAFSLFTFHFFPFNLIRNYRYHKGTESGGEHTEGKAQPVRGPPIPAERMAPAITILLENMKG